MSLFGQIANQVLGNLSGNLDQNHPMLKVAADLLQQNGGVDGLLDKFRSAGLDEHVSSWVGTGANLPIDASHISAALGSSAIGELAGKFGISQEDISNGLAQVLPQIVDKLTPNGSTQGSDALLQQGAALLGNLFAKG